MALNELKTLTTENADWVARHLVMAARLIEDDPTAAHQHALSAARRAGRIGVVRETLAITAYETGDYALALRELRTFRRITGSNAQLPLMVDSERGVGRPARALELGRSVDRNELPVPVRVALAIAMSGARLDLGQPELALAELEIPELDPDHAYEWSPALFSAYGEVLDELGQADEASVWRARAELARTALEEHESVNETVVVIEEDLVSGQGADDAAADDDGQVAAPDEDAAEDGPPTTTDDAAEPAEPAQSPSVDEPEAPGDASASRQTMNDPEEGHADGAARTED